MALRIKKIVFVFVFLIIIVIASILLVKYTGSQSYDKHANSPHYPMAQRQLGIGYRRILFWTPFYENPRWGHNPEDFSKCPVSRCTLTADRSKYAYSDVVVFHTRDLLGPEDVPSDFVTHRQNQVWVFFSAESPPNSYIWHYNNDLSVFKQSFNWTMTYRFDSTIPVAYGKYAKLLEPKAVNYDFFKEKSKIALWFVTNCKTSRMDYVKNLATYVPINIYGGCTNNVDPCNKEKKCLTKLKDQYKFFIAFENSMCKHYITEKFWSALSANLVPIVRGAQIDDYRRAAPPGSFIHVDQFQTMSELGEYLKYLDRNATAYAEYHNWRKNFEILQDPSQGWVCKICELAQNIETASPQWYNISEWWSIESNCYE